MLTVELDRHTPPQIRDAVLLKSTSHKKKHQTQNMKHYLSLWRLYLSYTPEDNQFIVWMSPETMEALSQLLAVI